MSLGMGGHQSAAMKSDRWLTPPHIVEALGRFDLDPCAAPEPRPWPTAAHHWCLPDQDGLTLAWYGRVWLNPPYSREAVHWLRRLAEHGQGTALVFARTETSWFVETVWQKASAVLFLHGRIHFHHPDGTRAAANSGAPSVLVAYGAEDANQLAGSGLAGTFFSDWTKPRVVLASPLVAARCVCGCPRAEHHLGRAKCSGQVFRPGLDRHMPCLCPYYERGGR